MHWILLWDTDPTSSTANVLERWVQVLVVVAQEHVEAKEGSVEVSVERGTGLVPGFTGYPSVTTVESERIMGVVVRGGKTHLSDDEDAVEDVGSECESSKKWGGSGGSQ